MQPAHANTWFGRAIVVLALTACVVDRNENRDATRASTSEIIHGSDSSAAQDEVILLARYQQVGTKIQIEKCTGTLIAPDLVLTARHCVSAIDDNAASCTENGIGSDYPPASFYVFVGARSPGDLREAATYDEAAARGKTIYTDSATNLCGHDLALLALDRAIPGAKIAPIRLERRASVNDPFTAVGWGMTETGTSDTAATEPGVRKQRGGLAVKAVGPASASSTQPELAAADFQVGESICSGDSGGPALSDTSHAVIGVVSRGGNGTVGTPGECIGSNTDNVYTQTAPFKSLILKAFSELGETPRPETDPRKAAFGESCQGPDDCQSSLCYQSQCSLDCFSAACPSGYDCSLEGNTKICKVPLAGGGTSDAGTSPNGATTTTSAGCALSPSRAPLSGGVAFGLFALALFARRSKRAG